MVIVSWLLLSGIIIFNQLIEIPPIIFYILVSGQITGSLWVVLRKTIEIMIFPGSNWCFRRSVEMIYFHEMASQVYEKLQSFKDFLDSIKKNDPNSQEKFLYNWKTMLETLIENYQLLSNPSKKQKKIFGLLISLKIELEHTIIQTDTGLTLNLWNWIDYRLDHANLICWYKDYMTEESSLKRSVEYCITLKEIFYDCIQKKNFCFSGIRWLWNDSIGTIEYLRADLWKRFKCQEFNIEKNKVNINW